MSWCTLPAFGDDIYIIPYISKAKFQAKACQCHYGKSKSKTDVGVLVRFPSSTVLRQVDTGQNLKHQQLLSHASLVAKMCEEKWRKEIEETLTTNGSKVPASYGIFHSCNASNAELPRLSVWVSLEKTVISPADKCGHYTVITFHIHFTMARHMSISHHLNAMKQDLAVCVGLRLRAEGLNAALTRSPLTLTLNGSCSQFGCSKEACLQYQFIRILSYIHATSSNHFCKVRLLQILH